jgi:hypothetical protein
MDEQRKKHDKTFKWGYCRRNAGGESTVWTSRDVETERGPEEME